MNRQERRRRAREGGKKPAWDLIIASVITAVIVIVLAFVYFFPNLNVENYQTTTPRVLRMIVNRGIGWLEQDWPQVTEFSFGHYENAEEWPSYNVVKGAETWQFTSLEDEEAEEYPADQLPEFYQDLPQVIAGLKAALENKEFQLAPQQAYSGYNDVSLIRVADAEKGLGEQYIMSFNAEHQLDRVIYYDSTGEEPVGYSYVSLYSQSDPEETNP
ncbi:MAG: hypothetical protein ACOX2K_01490 [Bacillota bacterium]|jgi:hypothetical protein